MSGVEAQLQFHEMVTDRSERLESLLRSQAFDQLVQDRTSLHESLLYCRELHIPYGGLSDDHNGMHGFPSQFDISQFNAMMVLPMETSDGSDEQPEWQFRAQYGVNGKLFTLQTNGEQSTLSTTTDQGDDLEYTLRPGMVTAFLASMSFIVMGEDVWVLPPYDRDEPGRLNELMHYIAKFKGYYQSKRTATIDAPEQGRELQITSTQAEVPWGRSDELVFRMLWNVGEGLDTEVMTYLRERSSDDDEAVTIDGSADQPELHYAERYGDVLRPLGMAAVFTPSDEDGRQAHVFGPHDQPLGHAYATVNSSILAILETELAPYAHLDEEEVVVETAYSPFDGELDPF